MQKNVSINKSTINATELTQIVNSEHGNPHNVLGMHIEKLDGVSVVSVRAFVPVAKEIFVVDLSSNESYLMNNVHSDGFFEAIIEKDEVFEYNLKIIDYSKNTWVTYDSYCFEPQLGDLDLYLFGQGNHYEIYDKLGAHVKEINGVQGVYFAVWAPNARRVSVVGDFNGWDGRRNPMRILKSSGIWELFIPGLMENDKYKYEIKTNDNNILKKADPYGNYCELRPNTASVVFDIEKYDWRDSGWMKDRKENNVLSKPMSVYEVHLGSWKRKNDNEFLSYIDLAEDLIPYIKQMGYTHIELMPVLEHPADISWGYQVTGYFAATARYGTPTDFMYFVDKCHENDIGVFLDWVPGHFIKDAHGLAKFDGTALYEHADPRKGEHLEWGTLIFNYGRNEVKNFLIGNAIFWLEKYHIDGLRVDAVASMLYLDYARTEGNWIPNIYGGRENLEAVEFFRHMNSIINTKCPGALMIAEESTSWGGVSRPAEVGGLGFNLKWNMGWMNDFLRYISKDPIHRKYHHGDLTFSMIYAYTENFILVLSHDEVVHGKGSMIGKMPGDYFQKFANLRLAYGFMYGHPGKKLMFMGGEFAQFSEWSEARSLDWHLLDFDMHKNMQKYVRALNRFYSSEKSLWLNDFVEGYFEWIDCSDNNSSVVSFIRKNSENDDYVIFVCNFTPMTHFEFKLGVPELATYREVFNSDEQDYGGSGQLNIGDLEAGKLEWNYRPQSIVMKVPPLGIVALKKVIKK